MVQMNLFANQKQRHRCREQTYGHQEGKWGWDGLGWHIHTTMHKMGSFGISVVKKPPGNAGDVGSIPGSGDLEKEMATHSSILAWEIPWIEEPDGPQSRESQELDTTQQLKHHQCIKQITNMDLLYSTGNSTQYSVTADMGKESKKRVVMCKPLC